MAPNLFLRRVIVLLLLLQTESKNGQETMIMSRGALSTVLPFQLGFEFPNEFSHRVGVLTKVFLKMYYCTCKI